MSSTRCRARGLYGLLARGLNRRGLAILGLLLVVCVVANQFVPAFGGKPGAQLNVFEPSPEQQVRSALDRARRTGSYRMSATSDQTILPAAVPGNIGQREVRATVEMTGEVRLPAAHVQVVTSVPQGLSGSGVSAPTTMDLYVSADGRTFIGSNGSIEPTSSGAALAGATDPLSYLAAADDVSVVGTELLDGQPVTRYAFTINGRRFSDMVREQMLATIRRQVAGNIQFDGGIGPGLALSGSGELWIDQRGLPRRQRLTLELPNAGPNFSAKANLTADFLDFGRVESIATPSLSADSQWTLTGETRIRASSDEFAASDDGATREIDLWRLLRVGQSIGIWVGDAAPIAMVLVVFGGGAVWFIVHRRRRWVYPTIVGLTLLGMLGGPLLQSIQLDQALTSMAQAAEPPRPASTGPTASTRTSSAIPTAATRTNVPAPTPASRAASVATVPVSTSAAVSRPIGTPTPTASGLSDRLGRLLGQAGRVLPTGMLGATTIMPGSINRTAAADVSPTATPAIPIACGEGSQSDSDGDGLSDADELCLGTSPFDADTHGSGLPDGLKVRGIDVCRVGGGPYTYVDPGTCLGTLIYHLTADPNRPDSNGDGMPDFLKWPAGTTYMGKSYGNALSWDHKGNGIPNIWNSDIDGDGIPNNLDVSPLSTSASTREYALTLNGRGATGYTYVDFQIRPSNPDHILYQDAAIDWPYDDQGQLQKTTSSSWSTSPPSSVKLIPMLQVDTDVEPPKDLASSYQMQVNPRDGGGFTILVPLSPLTENGTTFAYQARIAYGTGATAALPASTVLKAQMTWLVQLQNDKVVGCRAPPFARIGCRTITDTQIIQTYRDTFSVTGLRVTLSQGYEVAAFITPKTPNVDTALAQVLELGLRRIWADHESVPDQQTGETSLQAIVRHLGNAGATSSQRFGVTDTVVAKRQFFGHRDAGLAGSGDVVQSLLNTNIPPSTFNNKSLQCKTYQSVENTSVSVPCASVDLAIEDHSGQTDLDQLSGMSGASNSAATFNLGDISVATTRMSRLMNMTKADQQQPWGPMDTALRMSWLSLRYSGAALDNAVRARSGTYPGLTGDDLRATAFAGYMQLTNNFLTTTNVGGASLIDLQSLDSDAIIADFQTSSAINGESKKEILDVIDASTSLIETLQDSKSLRGKATTPGGAARHVPKAARGTKTGQGKLSAGTVAQAGMTAVAAAKVGCGVSGGCDSQTMSIVTKTSDYLSLAQDAKGVIDAVKALKSASKVSQVAKAAKSAGKSAGTAGLAFDIGLTWLSFGLGVGSGASPGTLAFDLALAQAIASTIFAVALFILAAAVPIGALIAAAFSLIDSFMEQFFGISISGTIIGALASLFVNVKILTEINEVRFGDFTTSRMPDPLQPGVSSVMPGLVSGDRMRLSNHLFSTISLKDSNDRGDLNDTNVTGRLIVSASKGGAATVDNNGLPSCKDEGRQRTCDQDLGSAVKLTGNPNSSNIPLAQSMNTHIAVPYIECKGFWIFKSCDRHHQVQDSPGPGGDIVLDVLPNTVESFFNWPYLSVPSRSERWVDPFARSSNNDGLKDGLALRFGVDPKRADSDGDGLTNAQEICHLAAGNTIVGGWNVKLPSGRVAHICSDPSRRSSGGDDFDDSIKQAQSESPFAYYRAPTFELQVTPGTFNLRGEPLVSAPPSQQVTSTLTLINTSPTAITTPMTACLPGFMDYTSGGTLSGNLLFSPTIDPNSSCDDGKRGTALVWDFSTQPLLFNRSVSTTVVATSHAIPSSLKSSIVFSLTHLGRGLNSRQGIISDVDAPSADFRVPTNNQVISPITGKTLVIGGTTDDLTTYVADLAIDPGTGTFTSMGRPQPKFPVGCPADAPGINQYCMTSWAYSWTLPPDGNYALRVRAIDVAGNTKITTSQVLIDGTSPVVTINLPGGGFVKPNPDGATVRVTGTAADPIVNGAASGLSLVQMSVDEAPWRIVELNGGSWTMDWMLAGDAQQGKHTISVRAYDKAGNPGTIATGTIVVDGQGPTANLTTSVFKSTPQLPVGQAITLEGFANDLGEAPLPSRPAPLQGGRAAPINALNQATVWLEPATVADSLAGVKLAWLADVNGDRRADLAIGLPGSASGAGRVAIVYGKAGDFPVRPDALSAGDSASQFVGAAGAGIGQNIESADANGDSLNDILIGDPANGRAFVVFGRTAPYGKNTVLDKPNRGVWSVLNLPGLAFVASAGDINGDGIGDLLLGTSSAVYVLLGRPAPWSDAIDVVREAAAVVSVSGAKATGVGDASGDALADFAISVPITTGARGSKVYLFAGASTFANRAATALSIDKAVGTFTTLDSAPTLAALGDVNGDGKADFMFTNGSEPRLVLGRSSGSWAESQNFNQYTPVSSGFIAAPGDVNGDGYADFLIGNADHDAYLVLGGPTVGSVIPPVQAVLKGVAAAASTPYASGADLNCDDSSDLLLLPYDSTGGLRAVSFDKAARVSASNLPVSRGTDNALRPDVPPRDKIVASTVAATGNTLTVDMFNPNCVLNPSTNRFNCPKGIFASVQDAVNASAPGDTIQLKSRPGDRGLTVRGDGSRLNALVDPRGFSVDGKSYLTIQGDGAETNDVYGGSVNITDSIGITLKSFKVRAGLNLTRSGIGGDTDTAKRIVLSGMIFESTAIHTDNTSVLSIEHSTLVGTTVNGENRPDGWTDRLTINGGTGLSASGGAVLVDGLRMALLPSGGNQLYSFFNPQNPEGGVLTGRADWVRSHDTFLAASSGSRTFGSLSTSFPFRYTPGTYQRNAFALYQGSPLNPEPPSTFPERFNRPEANNLAVLDQDFNGNIALTRVQDLPYTCCSREYSNNPGDTRTPAFGLTVPFNPSPGVAMSGTLLVGGYDSNTPYAPTDTFVIAGGPGPTTEFWKFENYPDCAAPNSFPRCGTTTSSAWRGWFQQPNFPGIAPIGTAIVTTPTSVYISAPGTGFYKYDRVKKTYTKLAEPPFTAGAGSSLGWYLDNQLYLAKGAGTRAVATYSIKLNTWTMLADLPGAIGAGGTLAIAVDLTLTSTVFDELWLSFDKTLNPWAYMATNNSVDGIYRTTLAGLLAGDLRARISLINDAFVQGRNGFTWSSWTDLSTWVLDGFSNVFVYTTVFPTPASTRFGTTTTMAEARFTDVAAGNYRPLPGSTLAVGDDYAGYAKVPRPIAYVSPLYCATCPNDNLAWNVGAFSTIQSALDSNASPVYVRPGLYRETIKLPANVQLLGAGPDLTVIQAPTGATGPVINASGVIGISVRGLTLAGDGPTGNTTGIAASAGTVGNLMRVVIRDTGTAVAIDGATTNLQIANDTFAFNGKGIRQTNCATVDVRNAVLANISGTAIAFSTGGCANQALVRYVNYYLNGKDIDDGTTNPFVGAGAVVSDPLFTDAAARDLRPLANSPVVDAGDPSDVTPPGGNSRIDIGYLETGGADIQVSAAYCDTCANDGLTFGVNAFTNIQPALDAAGQRVAGLCLAGTCSVTITVGLAAGEYAERAAVPSHVRLVGAGAESTTLTGTGTGPVITVNGSSDAGIAALGIKAGGQEGIAAIAGANTVAISRVLVSGATNAIRFAGGSNGKVRFSTLAFNTTGGILVDGTGTIASIEDSVIVCTGASTGTLTGESVAGCSASTAPALSSTNGAQLNHTYNLLFRNGADFATGLTADSTDVVGKDPKLAGTDFHLTIGSPAIDSADPSVAAVSRGGRRADLGYREVLQLPILLLLGKEGNSCALAASGVQSIETALVPVTDVTSALSTTLPISWTPATLKTACSGSSCPTTSYWSTTVTPSVEGLYRIFARATDALGNQSSIPRRWYLGDFFAVSPSAAPVVAWVGPTDALLSPPVTTTTGAAIRLTASVSGYIPVNGQSLFAIASTGFLVDGVLVPGEWSDPNWDPSTKAPRRFQAVVPLSDPSNHQHSIIAVATDNAGRQGTTPPFTVNVTGGTDVATITGPLEGGGVGGTSLTVTGYARYTSATGRGTVTVAANGTPVVATVNDKGAVLSAWSAIVPVPASGPLALSASAVRDLTVSSAGSRISSQSVVAKDASSSAVSVQVDKVTPTLTVSSPLGIVTGPIILSGTVKDDGSGVAAVEVSADAGVSWSTAVTPGCQVGQSCGWQFRWAPTVGTDGLTQIMRVRARDAAGNVENQSTSFVVDNVAPGAASPVATSSELVEKLQGEAHLTKPQSITVSWPVPTDGSAVTTYFSLDQSELGIPNTDDAKAKVTGTQTDVNLPAGGPWYAHVAHVDAAGNRSVRTAGPWFTDNLAPCNQRQVTIQMGGLVGVTNGEWRSGTSLLGYDTRSGRAQGLYATWDRSALNLAWTGAYPSIDGAVWFYIATTGPGSLALVDSPDVAALPFQANYAISVSSPTTGALWRNTGGGWTSETGLVFASKLGGTEVKLPWQIDQVSELKLLAYVADGGIVSSVLPTTNPLTGPWTAGYSWPGSGLCAVTSAGSGQPQTYGVAMTIAPSQAADVALGPGGSIGYAVTIVNNDPRPAAGMSLNMQGSNGIAFTLGGGCTGCAQSGAGAPIMLPTIASGSSIVLTVNGKLPTPLPGLTAVTSNASLTLGATSFGQQELLQRIAGTPPTVEIATGQVLGPNRPTLVGSAANDGGPGVEKVQMRLRDSDQWTDVIGKSVWSTSKLTLPTGASSLTIQARALDLFGQPSAVATATIPIAAAPPRVSLTVPAQMIGGSVITGTAGGVTNGLPASKVQIQVDTETSAWQPSTTLTQPDADGVQRWTYYRVPARENGKVHRFRARAIDSIGNTGTTTDWQNTTVYASQVDGGLTLSAFAPSNQATVGAPIIYALAASNLGPNYLPNAVVRFPTPTGLTNVTWTCDATLESVCINASGTGDVSSAVNLGVNGVATFIVIGTIADGAPELVAQATLTDPEGVPDTNLADNSVALTVSVGAALPSTETPVGIIEVIGTVTETPRTPTPVVTFAATASPTAQPSATVEPQSSATVTLGNPGQGNGVTVYIPGGVAGTATAVVYLEPAVLPTPPSGESGRAISSFTLSVFRLEVGGGRTALERTEQPMRVSVVFTPPPGFQAFSRLSFYRLGSTGTASIASRSARAVTYEKLPTTVDPTSLTATTTINTVGQYVLLDSSTVPQSVYSAYVPSVNSGASIISVTLRNDGTVDSNSTLRFTMPDGRVGLASDPTVLVQAGGSKLIYVPQLEGLAGSQYALTVSSDQPVSAVANLAQANNFTSTGYGALKSDQSGLSLYFPQVYRNFHGHTSNLVLQNVDTTAANVTVRYAGRVGELASGTTETRTIPPGAAAVFDQGQTAGMPDDFAGAASVSSDRYLVGVVNTGWQNGAQLSTVYGSPAGATQSYLPALYKGYYGNNSSILIQNVDTVQALVTLTYKNGAGASTTIEPGSSWLVYQPADDRLPDGWEGSAVVRSTNGAKILAVANISNPSIGRLSAYNGLAGGSTEVIAPALYKNYFGWSSSLTVQNVGTAMTSFEVVYNNGGVQRFINLAAGQSVLVYQPKSGVIPDGFQGAAAVRSLNGQPLVAEVNEDQPDATSAPVDWLISYVAFGQ